MFRTIISGNEAIFKVWLRLSPTCPNYVTVSLTPATC